MSISQRRDSNPIAHECYKAIPGEREQFEDTARATLDALRLVIPEEQFLDLTAGREFYEINMDELVRHIDPVKVEEHKRTTKKTVEAMRNLLGIGLGLGAGVVAGPFVGAGVQLMVQGDVKKLFSGARGMYSAAYGVADDIAEPGTRFFLNVVRDVSNKPLGPPPTTSCCDWLRCCDWCPGVGTITMVVSVGGPAITLVKNAEEIKRHFPTQVKKALGIPQGDDYDVWYQANAIDLCGQSNRLPAYLMGDPFLQQYISPMTLQLIEHPVRAPNGVIYESYNIRKWLENRATSPIQYGFAMSADELEECSDLEIAIADRIATLEHKRIYENWRSDFRGQYAIEVPCQRVLEEDEELRKNLCPITRRIIRHPVRAPDDKVYERDAIQAWLTQSQTSPFNHQIEITVGQLEEMAELEDRITTKIRLLEFMNQV